MMVDRSKSRLVVIAGGSGFLGVSLANHLAAAGWSVVILARRPPKVDGPFHYIGWDARTPGRWKKELDGATALINLVGRSVDCIKTPGQQDEILRSRVEATRVLGAAMRAVDSPPAVWIQMSTAHIYGDPPEVVCNEESPFGFGLAPFVAKVWEEEFQQAALPSQRQVILRTSFVIGRNRGTGNGALGRLEMLARLGLGGTIGSGSQGISWIHETDLNRLFERALTDSTMYGAYISSSPYPVSSRIFMRELRRAIGVPFGLPAYSWIVRIGAKWFLRTDPDLALCGRYVISRRLREEQFEFQYPEIREALTDLCGK